MITRIRPLKKNYRYRLVIHDWNYYILDTEKNLLSIFFPFLFWFTKQTMYQIDHETMESIRVITLPVDRYSQFRWNHLLTVLLLPLIRPIYEYAISFPWLKSGVLLWSLVGLFIVVRLFIRKGYENKFVVDNIDLTNLPKQFVKIKPSYSRQWAYHIGMALFFDVSLFFSVYFYIYEGYLGALLTFMLFLPLRLFVFTLFFSNPSIKNGFSYQLNILRESK